MAVRWVFEDPVTLDTYSFDINPNDGGSPQFIKRYEYRNTSAPDGKVIMYEGRDDPKSLEFSGVLLTEEQYNAFVEWWDKRYQVVVKDDLGREFSIVIESFNPKREKAVSHPWKHSYQIKATIVDWV